MRPGSASRLRAGLLSVFLLGSGVTAVVAVVVALRRAAARPAAAPPPPVRAVRPTPPGDPIAGEAQVFRTPPEVMAIAPAARRERQAHPRTLATYRFLRAYPGAPPRIPHELTSEEFRAGTCRSCHERGGYARRFTAYVPLTPHPAGDACLQCHLGNDDLMAVPAISPVANRRCQDCHGAGGPTPITAEAPLDWRTTAWPRVAHRPGEYAPPPIPHDLGTRGNCLACHGGPGAVAEIRTSHPQWTACRQCHVEAGPEPGVLADAPAATGATGGAR